MPFTPSKPVLLLLPLMILLLLYRRLRRNISRQAFIPRRITFRVVLLSLFTLLIAALSLRYPSSLAGLSLGILLGVPLGFAGLRFTHFETTEEGRFFTPNKYIGLGLFFLLVVRLAYRLTLLYASTHDVHRHVPTLLQSPLTLFILGILAGYFLFYYISLLVRNPVQ